jgi:hypothetical protein
MVANGEAQAVSGPKPRGTKRWWQRTWFRVLVSLVLVACVGLVVAAEYLIHNAEPIIRRRVVESLEARFHSPVQLDHLGISLVKGVEVEGSGLRILYLAGPNAPSNDGGQPMLSVDHFSFRAMPRALLRSPTRIAEVYVQGMVLHIPPVGARQAIFGPKEHKQPKITLLVDEIRCQDVTVFIDTTKPGKEPLEFDIQRLNLRDVGQTQPFLYDAELINPKPVGNIHATGHFGPWNSEIPRQTPLDGSYSFSHVNLSTIKGISGTLSSTGQFAGVLEHITMDGTTDTPDFAIDTSARPVPLHTVFHAYVDGTTGDTFLDPVQARLLHSDFTCRGRVVLIKGVGHEIVMDVDIPHARVEDMLVLAVKTYPPLMSGVLSMKAKLHIPPGPERVPQKLELAGSIQLQQVQFSNAQFQDRIDGLSARAQGKPDEIAQVSTDKKAEANSQISANFSLARGLMTLNDLHYQIPGALVLLNGVYSLDGNVFEFKGHVRTQATASQMVTGWKSLLLKPVDKFLEKNGAGLELPISISGTQGDMHFGLALHGTADESSKDMAADLPRERQEMQAEAKAKREAMEAAHQRALADGGTDGNQTKAEKKEQKEMKQAERRAEKDAAKEQMKQQQEQPSTPPAQPQ